MEFKMTSKLISFSLILLVAFCSCNSLKLLKENNNTKNVVLENAGLDKSTMNAIGSKRKIDMAQFKKTELDLPYADTNNKKQTLDIVYPTHDKAPYKTIVLIHGGGWMFGDKETESIASVFQATTQGYAVVSINYRLSDEVTWPKPLHDAKAAIRFIRANADKYQLDTKNLVAWGGSAGGHIAEMLGATNDQPAFEDLTMGNAAYSSAIQGIVAWYPVSDISGLTDAGTVPANKIMGFDVRANKDKTHDASPVNLVAKDFPPVLFVHGTNDNIVPYQQSVDMQKKIKEITDRKPEFITFKGAGHGDQRIKTTENVMNNLHFVDEILYNGKNPYRNTNYLDIKIVD